MAEIEAEAEKTRELALAPGFKAQLTFSYLQRGGKRLGERGKQKVVTLLSFSPWT